MKKSEFKNADAPATRKQTWTIFTQTKQDVRDENLTRWEASQLISALFEESTPQDKLNAFDDFMEKRENGVVKWDKEIKPFTVKSPKKKSHSDQLSLLDEARKAGAKAMAECVPTPMVVQEHENMLDDSSPVKREWHVSDGVCGFAWVVVKCKGKGVKFINALKKAGLAGPENSHKEFSRSSYYKGFYHHIHEGGQSYEKKTAYASAFARVLVDAGIEAYSGSRLD